MEAGVCLTRCTYHLPLYGGLAWKRHMTFYSLKEEEQQEQEKSERIPIFIVGATGKTGKRIVNQLLERGFKVRAGVLDVEKATSSLPAYSSLQIMKADVTEGAAKLSDAIGDAEVVIYATGFCPSLDFLALSKICFVGDSANIIAEVSRQIKLLEVI